MKNFWESTKMHIWKFVGALISDIKPNGQVAISLGRICFLAVLIFMFVLWSKSFDKTIEMPPALMEVFYTLAGYTFGSKALDAFRVRLGGTTKELPEDE